MNPDASGTQYVSSPLGEVFFHTAWMIPPSTIGITENPGMSMPSPMAVGDGMNRPNRGLASRRVRTTPMASAMISAHKALDGSAPNPFESSSAKPAHFTLMGEVRPPSPPIPYLARTAG